jgi:hypothetical protein
MGFTTEWEPTKGECRYCGEAKVEVREWESSDGAHEDACYQCTACKQVWWIDGIDA